MVVRKCRAKGDELPGPTMKSERSNNRRDFSFVKVRQATNGWRDPQKLVIRRHNLREGGLLQ
jgi:hypothetical protein